MIIGIKTFYKDYNDDTPSIQLWDSKSGESLGEYEYNSPKIPKECICCNSTEEFERLMRLARS